MQIKTLIVGQLKTNCYLVTDDQTKQTLIIDPGDDAGYIIDNITKEKLIPTKIIATHGHFDHLMAVEELRLAYRATSRPKRRDQIPFLIHAKDEFLVKQLPQSAEHFIGVINVLTPRANEYLKENDKIRIGDITFAVIETPGHTPGSICLHNQTDSTLFVGDLIFAGGSVGRTDFSYSNEKDLQQSIRKILPLPGETKIYSGHGAATNIKKWRID